MTLLRKTLRTASIALGTLVVGSALLWYQVRDHITPGMWRYAANVWYGYTDLTGGRTPAELIRYAKRRLDGHSKLEAMLLPPLNWIQVRSERPLPEVPLPTLGKGQQAQTLPALPGQATSAELFATSPEEILLAVKTAKAGQTILIKPGRYRLNQKAVTGAAGTPEKPITLRASQPGQVVIEVNALEGIYVSHPYWIFENLDLRGVCTQHTACEHAFHVVGNGHHLVLRNNRLQDFNAQLKINGLQGDWPDHGLVQYNTFTNMTRRETNLPVTPIDLVGASYWQMQDNIISNFVKGDGNKVSYGVFMKGGGREGHVERNLIICSASDISQPGVRVGVSFGGGLTGKEYCRDKLCEPEHAAGLAANNIIAHCNDFGIDINHAGAITVAHNTLINTSGIDVRGTSAFAHVFANQLEGTIRTRTSGRIRSELNDVGSVGRFFEAPDSLQLLWRVNPEPVPRLPAVADDFCRHLRLQFTPPGAMGLATPCVK